MNTKKTFPAPILAVVFLVGYFLPSPIGRNHGEQAAPLDSEESMSSTPRRERAPSGELPEPAYGRNLLRLPEEPVSLGPDAKSRLLRGFLLGKLKGDRGMLFFDVFNGDGSITKTFVELYGLSDREIATLTHEASQAREEHFQLARKHSEIESLEDGGVKVVMNPFEGAGDLYTRMLDSFDRVLGEERFSDFMKLGERELRKGFNEFGGEKLEVSVKPVIKKVRGPSGNSAEALVYEITESKRSANQNSTRRLNNISADKFAKDFGLVKRLIEDQEAK